VVLGQFSCGSYVIVVLNSDIVVFLNIRIFLLLARWFLAWLKLSNLSIFLFGVTEFSIPLAAGIASPILIFEHAYTSTIKQYSHGNLLCGCRQSLNPSAETFRKAAFILMDAEILWCNHSTITWYHLWWWWWWWFEKVILVLIQSFFLVVCK